MSDRYGRLAGMLGALALAAAVAQPDAFGAPPPSEVVMLESVLAIEDAQSVFGRYRVVFKTATPLPPARDASIGPRFHLGDRPITLPPYGPNGTLLFGYVDEIPKGSVAFTVTNAVPGDSASSQIVVDAEAMLGHSRPAPGEFEASHVRRSEDVVDLWQAWNDADVVFNGSFVRRDADPRDRTLWALQFKVEEVLRDSGKGTPAPQVTFETRHVPEHYEIGARYLVFARVDAASGTIDPRPHVAVRIWWPTDDSVTGFVRTRVTLGDLTHADEALERRARSFLMGALASPAAEVRRTAAAELLRLPGHALALTPDEVNALRGRIVREPSPVVRRALQDLAARGPGT